jgi:hypothetical protein
MEAGYSGTPLQRKLGVKPGMRVAAIGAPEHFAARLEDVRVATQLRGSFELIVFFASSVEARAANAGTAAGAQRARRALDRLAEAQLGTRQ